jgi:hypothetical protein
VSEFVDECRREWRRLGVPDPVANEMAADLALDLEEAEADGVSPEEVLGSSAFDPRSFAAAWAAERGVIPASPPRTNGARRGPRLPLAVAAAALVAAVGAALVIVASPAGPGGVAVALPAAPPFRVIGPHPRWIPLPRVRPRAIGPFFAVGNGPDNGARVAGSVLLVLGLAGVVSLTAFWVWDGRSRRRTTLVL